jgi:hypothetical protein
MGRLLDAVALEADPERRIERWSDVNRRYLSEVIRRARERVDKLVTAKVAGAAEALNQAAAHLARAQSELAAGRLTAAGAAYQAGMAAAETARPALQQAGSQLSATASDASAPNAGADLPPSILDRAIGAILPLTVGHQVTLKQVEKSLFWYEVGFATVIVVLAVLTGLQILYASNPAYSWSDLPVAILWGAGLHAVAGQSFQGLQSLAQQFR